MIWIVNSVFKLQFLQSLEECTTAGSSVKNLAFLNHRHGYCLNSKFLGFKLAQNFEVMFLGCGMLINVRLFIEIYINT